MIDIKNQSARYRAYSNYVIAIAKLLKQLYPDKDSLAVELSNMRGISKIQGRKVINISELEQYLRLAWNTELLLFQSIQYPALLPYSIPWSMVQSYYAVYAILRSYLNALGRHVEETHQSTLRTIGSDLTACKQRFPEPWCCVLDDYSDKSQPIIQTAKDPLLITLGNPLMSPYRTDPWQFYGLFLSSTRQRQIARKIERWKNTNGRKKIFKSERIMVSKQVRATTIFDALYRMRSRSNYLDVDSFIFTDVDQSEVVELQEAFFDIVSNTLFVFEFIIAKAISKKKFEEIVSEFVMTPNGKPAINTVFSRWRAVVECL